MNFFADAARAATDAVKAAAQASGRALATIAAAATKAAASFSGAKAAPIVACPYCAEFQKIVDGVNPANSGVNCGHIIDAAIGRLKGTNPTATAPAQQDGSFADIERRHGTKLKWNSSFADAYKAVQAGGDGTMAIVGIQYSNKTSAHVVVMANRGGTVAILEGQDWGAGNPKEVITTANRANARYNGDGGSNIGWGLVK
ncbi:MAG TPA: toxin glutamine deamidase domain-containing protein [Candidatus Binatia bacterium]|nr:toxin glutamine deamidase domain-containing protein [Candidatus Binatia bacterium]